MRNNDGTANIRTELVQAERRDRFVRRIEEVLGVESRVANEFVRCAVVVVRARSKGNVDHSLTTAIPCWSRARLNFKLLDGINRREKDQYACVRVDALDSIEEVHDVLRRGSVDNRSIRSSSARIALQN